MTHYYIVVKELILKFHKNWLEAIRQSIIDEMQNQASKSPENKKMNNFTHYPIFQFFKIYSTYFKWLKGL